MESHGGPGGSITLPPAPDSQVQTRVSCVEPKTWADWAGLSSRGVVTWLCGPACPPMTLSSDTSELDSAHTSQVGPATRRHVVVVGRDSRDGAGGSGGGGGGGSHPAFPLFLTSVTRKQDSTSASQAEPGTWGVGVGAGGPSLYLIQTTGLGFASQHRH